MHANTRAMIGALLLAGCASAPAPDHPSTSEAARPPNAAPRHDRADGCPMEVAGTTARAEDVDGGAAIVFQTTGDVAELRRRIAAMAATHGQHHGGAARGPAAHGGHHGAMGGTMGGAAMVSASARSEDVERGGRIVLTPVDPTQLEALRQQVREHATRMATGQCPMMRGHAATTTSAPDR